MKLQRRILHRDDILYHLAYNFLHGYSKNDLWYKKIRDHLMHNITKTKNIAFVKREIKRYIGDYNRMTAPLYHEILHKKLNIKSLDKLTYLDLIYNNNA